MSGEPDAPPPGGRRADGLGPASGAPRVPGRPGPTIGDIDPSVKEHHLAWLTHFRQALLDSGMSCQHLAKLTGDQKSHISDLMRGKRRYPRWRRVEAIARVLENHLVDTTLAEVRELWAQGAEDLGKTPGWVAKCWREKAVAVALAVALLLGGFIAAGAAGGSDVRATSERYDFLPEYTAPEPHSGTTWQLRTLATDDILVYRAPASLSSDDQAELLRVDEGTTLTLDCRAKVQKATFLKVSGSRTDYINVKSLSGPGSPDVSHLPECTTH